MFKNTLRISVIIAAATSIGCSGQSAIRNVTDSLVAQPDSTVELLESELRWMEDNLYRMDDQLEGCLRQLESTRRNNAALRLELAQSKKSSSPASSSVPAKATSSTDKDDRFDEEKEDEPDEYNLNAPVIDLGSPVSTEETATGTEEFKMPAGDVEVQDLPKPESILRPKGNRPEIESSVNPFEDDEGPAPDPNEITRIKLNKRLTGGFNVDGKEGHDGIMVVIEPQDGFDRYHPVAGPVTVEIKDPSHPGIVGQVAKWSFNETEIQERIKKTLMGQGIHLELPWPNGSPTAERLDLSVSYHTPSGRRLTANKELFIKPTTSALVTRAEAAEQEGWYSKRTPTASRWKPTR